MQSSTYKPVGLVDAYSVGKCSVREPLNSTCTVPPVWIPAWKVSSSQNGIPIAKLDLSFNGYDTVSVNAPPTSLWVLVIGWRLC